MSRGVWALAIGILGVVVATALFRLTHATGAIVAVLLLIACVGLIAFAAALLVEIPPRTGAAAGIVAVLLVAVVLAMTIAAAPLAPGAKRPGIDWRALVALAAMLGVCAASGWYGVRAGLFIARRRRA
jgi:hypothetical protein